MSEEILDEVDTQQKRDYSQEIIELLGSHLPPEELKDKLNNYHESDIAEALPTLSKEKRLKLYRLLGNEQVSEIFAYLDDVETFIEELSNEKAADIIEEMDAVDAVDVLEELDDTKREQIINLMDEDAAKDVMLIHNYDENVIGSKMSTNFVFVKSSMTIKEAMKSVVNQAAENDNISTVYVVDENDCYFGAFSLRDLVVARSTTPLVDITVTAYPYLYDDESISQCIEDLKDYSEDSIPVLSHENKILGVITGSELIDVVDAEMGEDYVKLAGLTDEEDLEEPLKKSIGKRLPWLLALMCLGLLVSALIGTFQFVIVTIPMLAVFQSLISGMSGNGGTQSLAVTIRMITSGDLTQKDKTKFIFKELRVGITNGLILGAVAFVITFVYMLIFNQTQNLTQSLGVSTCVAVAMVCAMFISSVTGTLIPMILKKLKLDPAVASGPLITTINDMIAVLVYYGLANIFLINLFKLFPIA